MSLANIARRMTLRGIVLIIILFVVTINAAHASDPARTSEPGRWIYDLFRSSVHVQYLDDDGSGIAIGPEGETIEFCVKGEPCDVVVPVIDEQKPQAYLPVITVHRRRPTN